MKSRREEEKEEEEEDTVLAWCGFVSSCACCACMCAGGADHPGVEEDGDGGNHATRR